MTQAKIIIADDHPMVRSALRQALDGGTVPALIRDCADFSELETALTQEEIDLVLLDLNMPGMHGLVGLLAVRGSWPTVPVIVVSATADAATRRRVRECGASGFIPKSAPLDVIAKAVRTVSGGGTWFDDKDLPSPLAPDAAVALSRKLASLTPQQVRVLQMVIEGKLNKQIAAEMGLAEQTVKGHVSAILRKLDLGSRTQVVIAMAPLLATETQGSEISDLDSRATCCK